MTRLAPTKFAIFAFGVLTLGFSGRSLSAATTTTTFLVQAQVVKACSVSATNLNFGPYDPTSGTALNQTSTITVRCTNGTSYQVGLSTGTSSGASVTSRKMTGVTTTNTLAYGLYQDAGHATNWGNTPGTDTPAAVTGTGLGQNVTVYGQIAANAAANIDTYTDTITATVTY